MYSLLTTFAEHKNKISSVVSKREHKSSVCVCVRVCVCVCVCVCVIFLFQFEKNTVRAGLQNKKLSWSGLMKRVPIVINFK